MEETFATELVCPKCKKPVQPTDSFCQDCAYPLKGTEEEKKTYGLQQWEKEFDRQDNQKKLKNGTITLFVVSGLFVIGALLLYAISGEISDLIVTLIVAGIYLGLGFASRKYPFPSILIGLILYLLLILLDAVTDPVSIFRGIIIKIFILGYMARALKGAYDLRQHQPPHQ